jgi:hypothetical protein
MHHHGLAGRDDECLDLVAMRRSGLGGGRYGEHDRLDRAGPRRAFTAGHTEMAQTVDQWRAGDPIQPSVAARPDDAGVGIADEIVGLAVTGRATMVSAFTRPA